MLNGKTKHKTSENSIHLNKTKRKTYLWTKNTQHTNQKLNRKQSRNLNEFFGVSNPGTAFKAKIQKQT